MSLYRPAGATHMNGCGEYFKYGRHGVLYRWNALFSEWQSSPPRNALQTISTQLAEDKKPDYKRKYRNRNYA